MNQRKSYTQIEKFAFDTVKHSYTNQAVDERSPVPDDDFLREQADVLLPFITDAIDQYFSEAAAPFPTKEAA